MPDHAPTTPQSLNDALVETYLRYIDTAYWLWDKRLMVERRQRLLESGMLATEPFLEPVLTYPATEELSEVADEMGIGHEVAELVGRVLFGAFTEPGQPIRLRAHQAEAVRATHLKPGNMDKRNIVVTSGTGSGETRGFLLPLLLRLVDEARAWGSQPKPTEWWKGNSWTPQTSLRSEERRPAAIRAMIAYPTNALVEDQMSRLRRAIHALAGEGVPLWFGRLTGASLGTVRQPNPPSAAGRTAKEVRLLVEDYDAMRHAPVPDGESLEDRLALFTDPRRNEMVVRWDMVQAPPDILVTNFSMLNAILMRDVEANMFACTRNWLEESREHVFTLVVDELHLHRGAAGGGGRDGVAQPARPDRPGRRPPTTARHRHQRLALRRSVRVPRAVLPCRPGLVHRHGGRTTQASRQAPRSSADSVLSVGPWRDRRQCPKPTQDMVASACYDEETGEALRHRGSDGRQAAVRHSPTRTGRRWTPCSPNSPKPTRTSRRLRSGPTTSFAQCVACGPAAIRTTAGRGRDDDRSANCQVGVAQQVPRTPFPSPSAESTSDRGRPAGTAAHECSSCSTATSAAT